MKNTPEAEKFFETFREVRKEITGGNGYNLAEAIMKTFDKWNTWQIGMPEFDGDYLCMIERDNECGTTSKYQQVIQCSMNIWILKDKEKVIKWKKLE